MHEMILLVLALVILERFQKLQERLLGHFASAPLQIGESREPEIRVQVVGGWVKGASDGKSVGVGSKLKMSGLGVLKLGCRFGGLVMLEPKKNILELTNLKISSDNIM